MKNMKNCKRIERKNICSFDLNDYINTDDFICDSDKIAKIIENAPVDTAFYLHIERLTGSNQSIQLLMHGSTGDIYYRVVSEEITPWKKVVTELDLNNVISEIRAELSLKADISYVEDVETRLRELISEKVSMEYLIEVETNLRELISEKASTESLSEVEAKLLEMLSLKASTENLNKVETDLRELIGEKASTENLNKVETDLRELIGEKASTENLNEVETKLLELISEKVSTEHFADVEAELRELLSEKANTKSLTDLEAKLLDLLNTKAEQKDVNDLKVETQNKLDEKADKIDLASLEEKLTSLEDKMTTNMGKLTDRIIELEDALEKTFKLTGGTALQANADLNDYKQVGNFYCQATADVKSILNIPEDLGYAFTMKVTHGNGLAYPSQLIMEIMTGNTFFRNYTDTGEWVPWIKLNK